MGNIMGMASRTRPRDLDFGPETCVLYLRISQDRTGQHLGVERQEKDCRDLAKRLGLRITRVYRDNDISATNGKVRPDFEEMLKARPEVIIAWHQDRLLRLTSDLEKVIALEIPVHMVTAGSLDLSTPAGRAVARTVAAWSQYEGEQKALRQKAANVQRAERGHWQFSRRPYGYRRVEGRIEVIEAEAEIIREAFRRYIAGETYYAIANDFNARAVPTLGTGGIAAEDTGWSMTRVRSMMRNPRLAGIVESNGHRYEDVKPQWEPIISERTWSDYLETRESRTRKGSWSNATKHLMSGLLVCGVCGTRLLARPEYRYPKGGERVTVQSYACQESWCVSAPAADVDPFIERLVLARLGDPRIVRALRKTPDAAPLQKELADLRRRRENITDLLAEGVLDRRRAREQAQNLTAKIDAASARLSAMRKESPLTDLALARSVAPKWGRLSVLEQRRVIEELGLRVTVNKTRRRGPRPVDAEGTPIPDLDRLVVDWSEIS